MSATLGSFCIAPIWSLRRMGFSLTKSQCDSFVLLWKYIGYYSGITPDILNNYFSDFHTAEKYFLSTSLYLFSFIPPSESLETSPENNPTLRILSSLSKAGRPFSTSLEQQISISSLLLGAQAAHRLGLGTPSDQSLRRVKLNFLVSRILVKYGEISPRRGWEVERRKVTIDVLSLMLRNILGGGKKKTSFQARNPEIYDKGLGDDEGEEIEQGVETAKGIIQ
jgi:hypothetical protein